MTVTWRVAGIYKADAQKVAEEIGTEKITPEEVLEKARDENSELHKCFEWNDSVAAEKYRLQQAGNVIRMLYYESEKKDVKPVRAFSLTTEQSTYQPTQLFTVQKDEYQSLLKRAMAELEAFKRKYHTLTELEEVFKAMEVV